MKDSRMEPVLSIRREDLRHIADLARLRIVAGPHEERRIQRVRQVLRAAAEVNRSLSEYLQHALVDCHGTIGAADLDADAVALGDALDAFSSQVRSVTDEYRSLIATHPDPVASGTTERIWWRALAERTPSSPRASRAD